MEFSHRLPNENVCVRNPKYEFLDIEYNRTRGSNLFAYECGDGMAIGDR